MSCSKWSIVFGSLAALSLLLCQNVARGEELESAPQPPDGASSAPAPNCVLPKDNGCCAQQPCAGEMCLDRFWIVDVDAVWLAPIQHQSFGTIGVATTDTTVVAGQTMNDSDFTLSPRITLGVQGECWGVLIRYWRLQTGTVDPELGHTADGLACDSLFRAETLDLELTRLLDGDCKENMFRLSFGFRYAQLKEAASLSYSELLDDTIWYHSSVFTQHEFSGPGLTVGLQGFHQVNCSNFYLFFDARASLIIDNTASNYVATRAYVGSDEGSPHGDENVSSGSANLFIGELQLGGQWNLPLKCLPANAFVRFAFEYQYWGFSNAGGAEQRSEAPIEASTLFAAGQSDGNTHIDLVGFNIGTGLTW